MTWNKWLRRQSHHEFNYKLKFNSHFSIDFHRPGRLPAVIGLSWPVKRNFRTGFTVTGYDWSHTESVLPSDPSWFILIYYLAIADLFISADLTCVLHPLVSLIWPCLPAMLTMDLLPTHPSHFLYLEPDQTTSAHTLLCRARHGVSTLLSHLRWRGRRQGHKTVVVLGEHPVFESTHWSTVYPISPYN